MKTGWAPWRMNYILGKKEKGCIFCLRAKKSQKKDFILFRGKKNFVILNRYPYNNGHLMIVPYRHIGDPENLKPEEMAEMFKLLQGSLQALNKAYQPEGYNIGMNVGRSGGAGIVGHLHLHIVPRWEADTNYMPVLAETRFLPEHLETTFKRVKKAWRQA